jgi:hypothetical protein
MTDEQINWDDMATSGFMKFEAIGDSISGTIAKVYPGTDFNGNPCPVLDLITEDGERTLSCGQANLKAQIVAIKPKAGETIKVTFDHEEKAALGMRKVFVIEHSNPLGATVETTEPAKPGF